ncbi:TraR/DksA C4-type zinc finger protein [Micromonospora chalcea]|uniref:TraR/DksA family transcriptional regulator n=1 Tax=Micromonospora chalcea TaxID=1874 RepID=UPI002379FC90|nr:TraR/DksA C4-type zinc finger protein [Micromonospora chalcea]WDQ03305.1 TraR/DksA C4-type zinc finger protein [Micromonospora chalcea]
MDAATHGVCERCGQPIGDEWLAARPFARFCLACAWGIKESEHWGRSLILAERLRRPRPDALNCRPPRGCSCTVGSDWVIFREPAHYERAPRSLARLERCCHPWLSDARYRRRALGRPASKRSSPRPSQGYPHMPRTVRRAASRSRESGAVRSRR